MFSIRPLRHSGLNSACVSRVASPLNSRYISRSLPRQSDEQAPKTSPDDAPTALGDRSSIQTRKETPSEAMARHQPDYNATVDHGTR